MLKQIFDLDEYDRKIIYELDKDSSMSIAALAKILRKSKQFTLFRMKRLEEEKIVTHYTAIVDMAKLGFFTFRIYVKFQQMSSEEINAVGEYLKTKQNIWTIAICHGKWDLAFFIGTKQIEDVHTIWDDFLLKYKKNVAGYNFSLYSPIYNFNRTFFIESKKEIVLRMYGARKKVAVDDTDWKIITAYAPQVRQSVLELSRKIRLSPETIRKRIKKLEKEKIICGYKIGLDINTLGYCSYRIDFELLLTSQNKELFEYCSRHKNIYQINKTLGGADFEIQLIVKGLPELLGIIEEIKARFKGVINNASYFSYSTYHLLNYIPD